MARTQRYKRIEKKFAAKVTGGFSSFCAGAAKVCSRVLKVLDCRLTVMIVPHSQGKPVSFQTNVFALGLGTALALGVAASFFYFGQRTADASAEISALSEKSARAQASLDTLRDENAGLMQAARRFQSALSGSLALLNINEGSSMRSDDSGGGDLASLFDSRESVSAEERESRDTRALASYLDGAVQPVEQIGKMLYSQNSLFKEIPSIWPIANPVAHLSMQFGPNVHPITRQWYIHKGLDFSTYRSGDKILATANGQVVTVGFDTSFGNYVIIKHKHGIYTRYAHMMYSIVKKGQTVSQGNVIGYVGNTGVTTGPHLHYEVHIGSDVVDPTKYINVKLFK